MCANTAALLQKIAKAKRKIVKVQPHEMLIYVDGCCGGKSSKRRGGVGKMYHTSDQVSDNSFKLD